MIRVERHIFHLRISYHGLNVFGLEDHCKSKKHRLYANGLELVEVHVTVNILLRSQGATESVEKLIQLIEHVHSTSHDPCQCISKALI